MNYIMFQSDRGTALGSADSHFIPRKGEDVVLFQDGKVREVTQVAYIQKERRYRAPLKVIVFLREVE